MPATLFRGGAAQGSPDFTVNGAPGVKSTRFWARNVRHDMRNPPRAFAGLGGARRCAVLWPRDGLSFTTSSAKRTRGTC
jgi:hypothetical protein